MDHLWSPWRMTYIENHQRVEGCIFCNALVEQDDKQSLVVFRGKRAFVILNRFPYTSAHLMIVPNVHVASLHEIEPATLSAMMELCVKSLSVLAIAYQPQGYNLGMNLGEAAGAGITDHIHMHVVPRWTGDTNFMSTTAETRVLPEALVDTLERIKKAWELNDSRIAREEART